MALPGWGEAADAVVAGQAEGCGHRPALAPSVRLAGGEVDNEDTPPPHKFRCAGAHRRQVKGGLPSLLQGSREWSCSQPRRFLIIVHNRWEMR